MPGEPLYVEVLTTAGDTIVTINGVQAAAQYLQFRPRSSYPKTHQPNHHKK
jgi:hypothetical protein